MHHEGYCWVFYESSCFHGLFSLSLIWVEQGEVLGLNCPGILIKLSQKGHPTRRRPSRINLRLMEEGTQTLQNLSQWLLIHNIRIPHKISYCMLLLIESAAVSVCTYMARLAGMQSLRIASCHEIQRWVSP